MWHISAGPVSRSFHRELIRHGIALVGPGDPGKWSPSRAATYQNTAVKAFAEAVSVGDVMMLRVGTRRLVAVGLVAGPYEFVESFDDMNGLDVQHCRRVRWFELPKAIDFERPVFGVKLPLAEVTDREPIEFATMLLSSPPTRWQEDRLPSLPPESAELTEIPEALRDVVGLARDLTQLYQNPPVFGSQPSEAEIVTHLVVPFFRAIGWPPELLGVEWNRVDLAVFDRLPRSPETCRLVVEAKQFGTGVEAALDQGISYSRALGKPRDVLVTDGVRYRLYDALNDFAVAAYANFNRLKVSAAGLFNMLSRTTG